MSQALSRIDRRLLIYLGRCELRSLAIVARHLNCAEAEVKTSLEKLCRYQLLGNAAERIAQVLAGKSS